MHEFSLDLLAKGARNYTKHQRKLAEFFVENQEEAVFLTIDEIAEKTGISKATIARFAQTLGFSGFHDFKTALQDEIRRRLVPSRKIESTLDQLGDEGSILHALIETQVQYLRHALMTVSESDLILCGKWIADASQVFVFGEGSSATPAAQLTFWLNRLGFSVHHISQTGRRFFDRLVGMTEADAVIAFAFRRQSAEASILFDWAARRKAHSVLITDAPHTPMAASADKLLVVQRGSTAGFRSMAVPVAIADALVISSARARGKQALRSVRDLDEMRRYYGFV